MPFISNQKRKDLIKKVNKQYFFRKLVIILTIVLFIVLMSTIVLISIGWILNFNKLLAQKLTQQEVWLQICKNWWSPFVITNADVVKKGEKLLVSLSWFGYLFIVLASITLIGAVTSIILTVTTKSPRQVQDCIEVLEQSPLSGEAISNISPADIIKKRRKPLSLNKKK